MTKWPLQSECDDFYGDPRDGSSWERTHLVDFSPPWRIVDEESGKTISSFKVNRRCADSLKRVCDAVWRECGANQDWIDRHGMHLFSGSYVFRNIRGGSHLSMHAYGCAIDFAASRNDLGEDWDPVTGVPAAVVKAFEAEGWTWGGRWKHRPDAMHFQAARVG